MPMKRPTNVSVESALLDEAKDLGINLSRLLEDSLRDRLAKARAQKWLQENAEAIAEYNDYIERNGMFSDGLRRF